MNFETISITFNDGTIIKAVKNGTCYIVDEKPEFPDDLTNISIEESNSTTYIEFGKIVDIQSNDGKYWFAIDAVSEAERANEQLRADIDYIAMEMGIDI